MKFALSLSLAVFFSSALLHAADDAPPSAFKLSGWTYGRERKTVTGSNRVTANVTIKNISKDPAADVAVTLTYMTGLGEKVFNPLVQKAGALKPGESKELKFVAELIPIFQSYSLLISFDGNKKENWGGNSDVAQPELRAAPIKGQANIVILGKEVDFDKTGAFHGKLHVKNEGTEVATGVKFTALFFDGKRKKLMEWSGLLGTGSIKGGAEEKIPFNVPGAPKNYTSYSFEIKNDDAPPEAQLSGGDFSGVADVEFAHFKFSPLPGKKSYQVEAECRNGFKVPVEQVKLELIFYGKGKKEIKRFTHELPGEIAAGGLKPAKFEIPSLPDYEEYEQNVSYSKKE